MRQVTITVDKAAWEDFDRDIKIINPDRSAINRIIECFQDGVDVARETMQAHLSVVGKEAPKETKQNTSNIIRIGPPPTDTEIKINIEDKLYNDIVWAAKRRSMSPKELADKWANDYIDSRKPDVSDVLKAIYAGLGWNIIESVK
jgi:hypothetical protein